MRDQTGSTTITANDFLFSTNKAVLLGSGAITIQPLDGSFAAALSTTNFTLPSTATSFTLGKSGNTADLTVAADLAIAGPIAAYGGAVTLSGSLASSAAGDILVRGSGAVTIASGKAISSTDGDITVTTSRLVNNAGASALVAGGTGKTWRVWSTNANPYHVSTGDVTGSLAFDYRQYNATYGTTTVVGTGKGLLYTLAPTLTASFTSTPTKVYDRTDTANVTSDDGHGHGRLRRRRYERDLHHFRCDLRLAQRRQRSAHLFLDRPERRRPDPVLPRAASRPMVTRSAVSAR